MEEEEKGGGRGKGWGKGKRGTEEKDGKRKSGEEQEDQERKEEKKRIKKRHGGRGSGGKAGGGGQKAGGRAWTRIISTVYTVHCILERTSYGGLVGTIRTLPIVRDPIHNHKETGLLSQILIGLTVDGAMMPMMVISVV